MSLWFIIILGVVAAAAIFAVVRLFASTEHRAGPENDWAQRNDKHRESRGPDDYIGPPTGGDMTGGTAE